MNSGDPILSVKNLSVKIDERVVLTGINFDVKADEVLAIVGPNGAGKSVLLKAILGLLEHSGTAQWLGNPKISYIPQRLAVEKNLPLSVGEFFDFKFKNLEQTISALKMVGITDEHHIESHLLHQRLGTLSGGQFQRVMIAWSLLDDPDVLLYDEPTSGIDVGGEETIYNLLARLKERSNLTMLLISHDLNIVYKYASNVLCINHEMICHGAPSQVLDPQALSSLYGGEAGFYQHRHS